MSLIYIGELSVGGVIPGAAAMQLAAYQGITQALSDLLARIQALQLWTPQPLSYDVMLTNANAILQGITLALSLGLPLPDIAAQIAQVAAILADLLAILSSVSANLTVVTEFGGLMGAAGIHAYAYHGTVAGMGADVTAALSSGFPGGTGGGATCDALVLGTTIGATWDVMGQVFRVAP